jgi:hypothetical protein
MAKQRDYSLEAKHLWMPSEAALGESSPAFHALPFPFQNGLPQRPIVFMLFFAMAMLLLAFLWNVRPKG